MQIKIIATAVETKMNKSNKPYTVLEVTYKNLSFQGKVEAKKIFSFGAQEGAYKSLVEASANTVYDVEVVKNAQGYNDWVAVKQGVEGAAEATPAGKSTPTKSTYETPDERAARQILIVRQSSLSAAVATLTTGAKSPPNPDDVMALAQTYSDFVFQVGAVEPTATEEDIPF